jgi:beta-1,4-mannosyl-glycoprotein beta-1,4-N-acetylglucosaminyltransferase
MKKIKVIDCITFFDENLLTNLRIELLYNVVDRFIICESMYDHSGKKKKINFKLFNKKFKSKIIHLIHKEKFPAESNGWDKERIQREYIFKKLKKFDQNDLIMYSDSDEIPNPKLIKKLKLEKKFGIFLQKMFSYKFTLLNRHEMPWPGTRVCKLKNLNSFTYLRKKVWPKNLKYNFWRLDKERSIQLIQNGGWHFQNFYPIKMISKKLKTYPHIEFSTDKHSSLAVIKDKIKNKKDVFFGRSLQEVNLKKNLPIEILKIISNKRYFFLIK